MTAQQLFDQHQAAKRNHEAIGFIYKHPFGALTVEQIQVHFDFCKQMGSEFHLNCDPAKMAGKSQDEIRAEMEARSKKHKRGAGYRALKGKYGEQVAKEIIGKNR